MDDTNQTDNPQDTTENLKNLEEAAPVSQDSTGAEAPEAGSLYKPDSPDKGGGRTRSFIKKNRKWLMIGGGGGLAVFGMIIVLFLILSSLKAVHFSQVLATAGMSRFNGIMQERMTQDLFDAQVTRGDGAISLRGKTMLDRFLFRNVDRQLADLGRSNNLRLTTKNGVLDTVTIGDKSVSLDGITKELKLGDSYADIGKLSFRERATVRYEFTSRLQATVGDVLATEPRYVRGRLFGTIADNVGFKFSRFRQWGRSLIGLTPDKAISEAVANDIEEVVKPPPDTGVPSIDESTKQIQNREKLVAFLEKNGGEFDPVAWAESIKVNNELAGRISDISSKVAVVTLITTMACMANEAFSRTDSISEVNEAQATNAGMRRIATGQQIKTGQVVPEAVGAANRQVDGAEKSQSFQYQTGQQITAAPNDIPRITPEINSVIKRIVDIVTAPSKIANKLTLGLVDDAAFCKLLLSPIGQGAAAATEVVASAVVSVLTDGSAEAAALGLEAAAKTSFLTALKETAFKFFTVDSLKSLAVTAGALSLYSFSLSIVSMLIGHTSFTSAEGGSQGYTNDSLGTVLAQSRELRTIGGKPIPVDSAIQSDSHYSVVDKKYWGGKSFYDRYFAVSNPYSLVGRLAAMSPTVTTSSLVQQSRSAVSNIGSLFSFGFVKNLFASIGLGKGYAFAAASGFDPYYGLQQWGFSSDELDKMRSVESYSMANNADNISDAEIAAFDNGPVGKCFDPARSQYSVNKDSKCSTEALSGDKVLRYRIYKLDALLSDYAAGADLPYIDAAQASTGGTNQTTATGNSIYVLGDSLTTGMRDSGALNDKLTANGWQTVDIQAQCGRHLKLDGVACPELTSTTFPSGISQIEKPEDAAFIKKASAIVVGLGTNDPGDGQFDNNVRELVQKIRVLNTSAPIYWINLFSTDINSGTYQNMDTTLSNLVTAGIITKLINWSSVASAYYDPGNVHPYKHYPDMAAYVAQIVGKAK